MKAPIWLRFRFALQRFYYRTFRRINRLGYLRRLINKTHNLDEVEDELDELQVLETAHWTNRGRKVHLIIQDIPLPEGERTHFRLGNHGSYIVWSSLRQFKKLVEDAEYERNKRKREGRELWVKWFTAIFAAIGALTGLYLAFVKGRK